MMSIDRLDYVRNENLNGAKMKSWTSSAVSYGCLSANTHALYRY
jgi:hypothetical protein